MHPPALPAHPLSLQLQTPHPQPLRLLLLVPRLAPSVHPPCPSCAGWHHWLWQPGLDQAPLHKQPALTESSGMQTVCHG